MTDGLKYIGNSFLIGVPARDLSADETEKFGRETLIKSGLYVEPEPKPEPEKPVKKSTKKPSKSDS